MAEPSAEAPDGLALSLATLLEGVPSVEETRIVPIARRAPGFYWVKNRHEWLVARWRGERWEVPGSAALFEDGDFYEIGSELDPGGPEIQALRRSEASAALWRHQGEPPGRLP